MVTIGKIVTSLLAFIAAGFLILVGVVSIREGGAITSGLGCVAIIISAEWVPLTRWIWRKGR